MTKNDEQAFLQDLYVWDFEFGSRSAQALAPRVGICLKFGFWCLEFS